jgi:amino acid transporter
LLLTLAGAGVVGIWHSLFEKRNLLPAAMQQASYLAGYLVLLAMWIALSGVLITIIAEHGQLFRWLERVLQIDDEAAAFFTWFIPAIAGSLIYFVLVHRGTGAARYANK